MVILALVKLNTELRCIVPETLNTTIRLAAAGLLLVQAYLNVPAVPSSVNLVTS